MEISTVIIIWFVVGLVLILMEFVIPGLVIDRILWSGCVDSGNFCGDISLKWHFGFK